MPENAPARPAENAARAAAEFTGERVIPGQVDADLWNEHKARYAFAARLSRHKRVLDVGCGTGYGTFELARYAYSVSGIDVADEALVYAADHYRSKNITWSRASATALPFPPNSFDLVVGFEVIEHLNDWQGMLAEAQRVLKPGGQFIVSTPNKNYYAESRRLCGPNPFHEHEFEFDEFQAALAGHFPHVAFFLEDHTEGILFQAISNARGAEVRLDREQIDAGSAHFFVAVCAMTPQTGAPTFVYIPTGGNVLRERELHIKRLEDELQTKNEWLDASRTEHAELVQLFRTQKVELEETHEWGERLSQELAGAAQRLQDAVAQVSAGYEAKVRELEEENRQKTAWAQETDARLSEALADKCRELAEAVELLHQAEATMEERTRWALDLQAERERLEARLNLVEASRWIRLGRAIGVGPRLRDR